MIGGEMMAANKQNGPKQCAFSFFYNYVFYTNLCFIVYLGYKMGNTWLEEKGWPPMSKTGPNDSQKNGLVYAMPQSNGPKLQVYTPVPTHS